MSICGKRNLTRGCNWELSEPEDLLPDISTAGEGGTCRPRPETVEIQHTCGTNQQIMPPTKSPPTPNPAHRDRTETERGSLDGSLARHRRQPTRLGSPVGARIEVAAAREATGAQPGGGDAIETEIERAVLLGALDRRQEAQQAFIDILRRAPTHFSALNEFGTLLTDMGAIDAACRVYAEAILHHPENPMAHVNLANLLLRANRYTEARGHYEAALRIDPDHAPAHQGLGAVLADLGDRAGAGYHFYKGFRDHADFELPYRGTKPPVTLLQLVSSGGGNIPTAAFLDDRSF